MDGCLWNQTVRSGNADQSSDEGSDSKQEKVVVKSRRLAQGEFRALRYQ